MKVKLKLLKRIIIINAVMILFVVSLLTLIFGYFSSMSGLANAINHSGSERMRTILLGSLGNSYVTSLEEGDLTEAADLKKMFNDEVLLYDRILSGLVEGDPDLGLQKTDDPEILGLIDDWAVQWKPYKEALSTVMDNESLPKDRRILSSFQVKEAISLKNTVNKVVLSYSNKSNEKLKRIQQILVLIIVSISGIGLFSVLFVRKSLLPVGSLIKMISLVKDRDLTVRNTALKDDEIGYISEALNNLTSVFDRLIGDIRKTSRSVDSANNDLASSITESVSAVREMVATIDSTNHNLSRHHELVESNVKAVEAQKAQTNEIAEYVHEQSAAVNESSANIEEMAASVQTVNKSTSEARDISRRLSDAAHSGWDKIEATITAIGNIKEAAQSVQDSVNGIEKIAATTNLLSMNAAIEAAHAGSAGAGFSVVAGEINKLAGSSADEAKKIKQIMNKTMSFIEGGSALSSEVSIAFKAILEGIQNTVEIILNIAAAMDQQGEGVKDILLSIETLVGLTNKISAITGSGNSNANDLLKSIRELERLSLEISNASNEQRVGGDELLNSMDLLQKVSVSNQDSVNLLNSKIDVFKVSES